MSDAPAPPRALSGEVRVTTRRNVALLTAAQGLSMSVLAAGISVTPLAGYALAPLKELATLPVALQFVATAATALPASLLMRSLGRRAGFLIGAGIGAAGAALAALAVMAHSFSGLCLGVALLGSANGFALFYRFAAAEAASREGRALAISLVVAGGLVAAFLGPNLARASKDLWLEAPFAGTYAALVGVYLVAASLLAFLTLGRPAPTERSAAARPLLAIARGPVFIVAAAAAIAAYGVMNFLMTATPLAMHANGHSFGTTASVIQWHVVGMYAPALVAGWLVARLGAPAMIAAGMLVLGAGAGISLTGTSYPVFALALGLIGVGWSLSFVAATDLLGSAHGAAEKAKTQGLNDLLIFATVAATALGSGVLHELAGWTTLSIVALVPIAVVLALTARWAGTLTQAAKAEIGHRRGDP